jgi:uncharacterized SAM-binding protein YcdF (DUF218 family)
MVNSALRFYDRNGNKDSDDENALYEVYLLQLILGIAGLIFRLFSFIGIAAVILAFLLVDFISRSDPYQVGRVIPRTAVVFTGDFDRIYRGLALMSADRVDRLFITGVNGDAGLNAASFPRQFGLNADQVDWIATGKIVLAPDGYSTLENALEAACWLDRQSDIKAVTLVTSRRHMARASVALQHAIAPMAVVRMVSDPAAVYDRNQLNLHEFGKFVATWFITLLPRRLWPGTEPSLCWDR